MVGCPVGNVDGVLEGAVVGCSDGDPVGRELGSVSLAISAIQHQTSYLARARKTNTSTQKR